MVVWSVVLMLVGLWQGAPTPPGPSGQVNQLPFLESRIRQAGASAPRVPLSRQLQKSRDEFLALHRSV